MKQLSTKKDSKKLGQKELESCRDCAEYGGHFCDECLEELLKRKEKTS